MCVCLSASMLEPGYECGGQRTMWELVLSLSHVGPRDQTQVVKLGDRPPHALSLLTSSMVVVIQLGLTKLYAYTQDYCGQIRFQRG